MNKLLEFIKKNYLVITILLISIVIFFVLNKFCGLIGLSLLAVKSFFNKNVTNQTEQHKRNIENLDKKIEDLNNTLTIIKSEEKINKETYEGALNKIESNKLDYSKEEIIEWLKNL